ncbi:MAG: CPBP family intramembrane metalloprotease [Candidatus Omnitrophica bacterium]|nr:CPBP family intramembrane metalloprotease [Candidatus Omnitrophota bacterium]
MTRSFLRSRWLYAVLALLIIGVYVWGRPTNAPEPLEAIRELPERSREWMPQTIDAQTWRRVVRHEPATTLALVILGLFSLVMTCGGIALAIRAVMQGTWRSWWTASSTALPPWSFGELFRIMMLAVAMAFLLSAAQLMLVTTGLLPLPDPHVALTVAMLLLDVFVGLMILSFAAGKGRSVWATFGLTGPIAGPAMTIGLRSYMTAFPWLFGLLWLVAQVVEALGIKQPIEPIQELVFREQRPFVLGLTVVLACTVGPIVEELFFRGVLYTAIRQRTSRLIGMLASAAIFALLHTNVVGFLPIVALGCVLAYLYERTGSLAASLAVHVLHNSFLISTAMVFRHMMSASPP